jgi:hypothetical protein
VNRLGAELAGQGRQLALGGSVAVHDPAEPLVELVEALEHEARARGGRVSPVQQPRVEAEHGHDPLVRVERRAQRRVVVRAQVSGEPYESRHRPRR